MIIVLMGVTGSGKTTAGQKLAAELGWNYFDADDFHSANNVAKMKRGVPLNDDDRKPWLESLRQMILQRLTNDQPAVLARDIQRVRSSPYLPAGLPVLGAIYDLDTGRVEIAVSECE